MYSVSHQWVAATASIPEFLLSAGLPMWRPEE